MAWVISLLGAVLAVGGGVALWSGSGYIRLDWGQAQTVAGTVALSAGIVTLAIAAVLFALRDLARRPARASASGVGFEALHLADEPEAPARARVGGRLATAGLPKAEPAEPAVPPRAGRVEPVPAMPAAARDPAAEPFDPPPRAPAEPEPAPDPRPRPVPEAPRAAVPVMAEAPTVVGRYEANGASYVLFSDGTIEVETESGTHRFASMAALKDHIERQDAV